MCIQPGWVSWPDSELDGQILLPKWSWFTTFPEDIDKVHSYSAAVKRNSCSIEEKLGKSSQFHGKAWLLPHGRGLPKYISAIGCTWSTVPFSYTCSLFNYLSRQIPRLWTSNSDISWFLYCLPAIWGQAGLCYRATNWRTLVRLELAIAGRQERD